MSSTKFTYLRQTAAELVWLRGLGEGEPFMIGAFPAKVDAQLVELGALIPTEGTNCFRIGAISDETIHRALTEERRPR